MKCPKCGEKLVKRRNYAPSTGFMPGHTWTHIYGLAEALKNPGLCRHTIREDSP